MGSSVDGRGFCGRLYKGGFQQIVAFVEGVIQQGLGPWPREAVRGRPAPAIIYFTIYRTMNVSLSSLSDQARGNCPARGSFTVNILGGVMDAGSLNFVVLSVLVAGVFFYVLYLVIRAAVRDGIVRAYERRTADVGTRSSARTQRPLLRRRVDKRGRSVEPATI